MTSLDPDDTAERVRERLPEVRRIYDNILENCTSDAIRVAAKGSMCHFLARILEKDPENCESESAEIKQIIEQMPDLLDTRQYNSTMFLPGTHEERITACQRALVDGLQMLNGVITHLSHGSLMHYHGLRAMLAIYETIYPDGDYGKNTGWVMNLWTFIALWHDKQDEYEQAFAAMQRCAEITRDHKALPKISEHTSPLMHGLSFEKTFDLAGMRDFAVKEDDELYELYSWSREFRDDPRFAKIIAEFINSA